MFVFFFPESVSKYYFYNQGNTEIFGCDSHIWIFKIKYNPLKECLGCCSGPPGMPLISQGSSSGLAVRYTSVKYCEKQIFMECVSIL